MMKISFKHIHKKSFVIKKRNDLTFDALDLTEFTNVSNDFEAQDFSIFKGPITRAGPFPYKVNGTFKNYYKQWDNLKDVFSQLDYLPLIGSKREGSHHAKTIGFAYNFENDEENKRILADIITLENIDILSNNYKPKQEGWEVSIGFQDHKTGNIQIVRSVDHLAMSLRNEEIGRCRAGGDPCYAKPKEQYYDQNLKMEVMS